MRFILPSASLFHPLLLFFWANVGHSALFAQQRKPELFVLTVGIERYKDATLNLNYAADDAEDLASMFKKQTVLWNVKDVKTLTDSKAKGNDIVAAIDGFAKKVTSDDFFVFVFSGHGIEGRLVPHDYDGNAYRSTLGKEELLEHLDRLGCGYMLFIDACHSGSFAKSLPGGKNIGVEGDRNLTDKATKELVDALSGTDKPYLVFGSSGTNQKSWECKPCGHGYFAQAVLDAFANKKIKEGKATYTPDADANGLLTVSELDHYLKEAVRIATQAQGGPQKVYSRLTMGTDIALAAWGKAAKSSPTNTPAATNNSTKNVPTMVQRFVAANQLYALGCSKKPCFTQQNGSFLGPSDFKTAFNANNSPNAGIDFYREILLRHQVAQPDQVLALLHRTGDDYMVFTQTGIYWEVSVYDRLRWAKRKQFMPYEDLKKYKLSSDKSYLTLREIGNKKNRLQLLMRHRDDMRGMAPGELKAFLEALKE